MLGYFKSKRFWSGFVGFLGVVGVAITLIAYFFPGAPAVEYLVVKKVDVFDVRTSVDDLRILFRDDDIQKKNENLRIYTVRVVNNGNVGFTPGDFDQTEKWGLKISEGRIARTSLPRTNSDYLNRAVQIRVIQDDSVDFSTFIFDKNESFEFDLIVIHVRGVEPKLASKGKLKDVKVIPVTNVAEEQGTIADTIHLVFRNSLAYRIFFYFVHLLVVLLGFTIIGAIIASFVGNLGRAVRKRRFARVSGIVDSLPARQRKLISDRYANGGISQLRELLDQLSSPEKLRLKESSDLQIAEIRAMRRQIEQERTQVLASSSHISIMEGLNNINSLARAKVISKDDPPKVSEDFLKSLKELIAALE